MTNSIQSKETAAASAQLAGYPVPVLQQLILESAKDYAIFTTDLQRRVTSWNAGAETMLGYAHTDILGQLADILFVPEDQQDGVPLREVEMAIEEGRAENERWHARQNGTRLYGSGVVTPLFDENGKLVGLLKVMRDLTLRQQAQQELHRAEQRKSYLLALSDALRPLADPLAIQATVARTALAHFETERCYYCELASGKAIVQRDAFRPGLSSVVGVYPLDDFLLFKTVVDAEHPFAVTDVRTTPLVDEPLRQLCIQLGIIAFLNIPLIKDGEPIGIFCLTQAVPRIWTPLEIELAQETAERTWTAVEYAKVGQALREQEQRTRLAVEAARLGTWEWDLLTDRVYWNDQHFYLLGMAVQTKPLFSDAFTSHLHPADVERVQNDLKQTVNQHCPYDTEFRIIRDDGVTRWMSGYGQVTAEIAGQASRISGVVFDINDRKQAEAALQEADRRKDEFLAMLAHELRNPMATLRNGLQILTQTTAGDEISNTTVDMMNRQTNHLVRLVDDLLDVSRISRGRIELRKERVNLVELVRQAVDAVRPLYQERDRYLHVDLPTAPIYLDGDATRLTQVVTNLLTNGVRYTGEQGQVWLSLTTENGSSTGQREAVVQVRDNGIGLTADQLMAIFDLFVQVDNSSARSQGGLGLGLTLVRRLVDMHGGRVDAQSDGLGKGSTFRVYLPTIPPTPEAVDQSADDTPDQKPNLRILIVDDNPDAALTLGMLLKLRGYEIHTRHSGRAGLDATEQLKPAAVLLDIGMPEMDGYETARLMRQQPWGSQVALIALTGYGQDEDRQRTREAGFDDHLIKPVDLGVLLDRMTTLTARRKGNG